MQIADDVVSLCTFRIGEDVLGIDTAQVQEVLGECVAHRVPLAPDFVAGVLPYRGEVLVTLSLRALLGRTPAETLGSVLVLRDPEAGESFGLAVDAVADVQTMRMGDLEENPCMLDEHRKLLFSGAFRLRDSLVICLNAERLRPSRWKTGLHTEAFGEEPEQRKDDQDARVDRG